MGIPHTRLCRALTERVKVIGSKMRKAGLKVMSSTFEHTLRCFCEPSLIKAPNPKLLPQSEILSGHKLNQNGEPGLR
jgi:hypothetical protein